MYKRSVVVILGIVIILSLSLTAVFAPRLKPQRKNAGERIAVIFVDGVIIGGRGQATLLSEGGGTDALIKQIHEARDDGSVKAVVLRINSPGGSVPATQEVGEELIKLKNTGKPLVASMGDIAASGGYWLAAVCDKIYANPGTLTGSIGVYMPYANWEELFKKLGVRQEKIKSGEHKDILSPDRPMTGEERAIIQAMVDEMYGQFVQVVAEGRKMDPAKVRLLADGRIYTGNQAKEAGLVDNMGNLYDALEEAARLGGIQGKPEIKEYGKFTPWELLMGPGNLFNGLAEKILLRHSQNELPITAPLAMPEKW